MKKRVTVFIIAALIISLNIVSVLANSDSLEEKYKNALKELEEKGFGVNNFPDGLEHPEIKEGKDAETLFKEVFGDKLEEIILEVPASEKNKTIRNLEQEYKSIINKMDNKSSNRKQEIENMLSEKLKERDANSEKLLEELKEKYAPDQEVDKKINEMKKNMLDYDSILNQTRDAQRFIRDKRQKKGIKETLSNGMEKVFDGAEKTLGFLTGKEKDKYSLEEIEKLQENYNNPEGIGLSKKEQELLFKDSYARYYYQKKGKQSNEQEAQRKEILKVLKDYNIFDSSKIKNFFKKNDEKFMGKLMIDNLELLEREVSGFKGFTPASQSISFSPYKLLDKKDLSENLNFEDILAQTDLKDAYLNPHKLLEIE